MTKAAFIEAITELWEKSPDKRFGLFISEVAKNPTELYLIEDIDLLKRLTKGNT